MVLAANQTLKAQAQAELNKIAYDLRHGVLRTDMIKQANGTYVSGQAVPDALRGLDLIQEALDTIPEQQARWELEREQSMHERHVDLMASCRLCRIEAGDQPDRLTQDDDDE